MDKTRKAESDEILYLNEIHDEVSRPLTSNVEAVPSIHSIPQIDLRAGFSTEADENVKKDENNSSEFEGMPVSGSEIDEHNDEKLNEQPVPAISFDNKNGILLESEFSPTWPNNMFSSSASTTQTTTPDVNIYQHKKTLAQGMMDLALLSANANQMRYVLQTDGRHPYFYPSLTMISMSLFLQIAVGIGLIWNSVYNVKKHEQMCKANKANNWTVIGIFLVTILNVFISSFGVVDQATVT